MLNSLMFVQASPCSPYILLGMRKEGRRSGCSSHGAQFSAMPPPAFSSLLSEFGAACPGSPFWGSSLCLSLPAV